VAEGRLEVQLAAAAVERLEHRLPGAGRGERATHEPTEPRPRAGGALHLDVALEELERAGLRADRVVGESDAELAEARPRPVQRIESLDGGEGLAAGERAVLQQLEGRRATRDGFHDAERWLGRGVGAHRRRGVRDGYVPGGRAGPDECTAAARAAHAAPLLGVAVGARWGPASPRWRRRARGRRPVADGVGGMSVASERPVFMRLASGRAGGSHGTGFCSARPLGQDLEVLAPVQVAPTVLQRHLDPLAGIALSTKRTLSG
jgi:hypothetical protein